MGRHASSRWLSGLHGETEGGEPGTGPVLRGCGEAQAPDRRSGERDAAEDREAVLPAAADRSGRGAGTRYRAGHTGLG